MALGGTATTTTGAVLPCGAGTPAPSPAAVRTLSWDRSLSQTSTPTRGQREPDRGAEQPGAHDVDPVAVPAHSLGFTVGPPAPGQVAAQRRGPVQVDVRHVGLGSSDSTWASSRTTRGMEPSISSSRAHSSGISPNPSWRAAYAGNSACRSRWR